jgi:polyhydroxyalkanoate synthase
LLAIGAAALAARGDQRIGSLSLFAAQTDFSEPGELSLFISPGQLAMLDAQMYRQGVLESSQMGGAFQLLRPQDLIFQPAVNAYLKGERENMVDLMAWNADGTRMPWKMHSEYLHRLYLHNELANHRFPVAGKTVTLNDVRSPAFVVGTETDHVAPWKSVYKADRLLGSDSITFLLTSGGHNAGIVSGPVHPKRHHRVRERKAGEPQLTPGEWMETVERQPGSWWPIWESWLAERGGPLVKPPKMGSTAYPVVCPAPGTYVLQR